MRRAETSSDRNSKALKDAGVFVSGAGHARLGGALPAHAEWLAARKNLLAKEKESTRLRDALSAERRRLPMVKVKRDYVFEGPTGTPCESFKAAGVGQNLAGHE